VLGQTQRLISGRNHSVLYSLRINHSDWFTQLDNCNTEKIINSRNWTQSNSTHFKHAKFWTQTNPTQSMDEPNPCPKRMTRDNGTKRPQLILKLKMRKKYTTCSSDLLDRRQAAIASTKWATLVSRTCAVGLDEPNVRLKPGFHYPSWRPELTARVDGWPVSITRQHEPSWRAVNSARQLG